MCKTSNKCILFRLFVEINIHYRLVIVHVEARVSVSHLSHVPAEGENIHSCPARGKGVEVDGGRYLVFLVKGGDVCH